MDHVLAREAQVPILDYECLYMWTPLCKLKKYVDVMLQIYIYIYFFFYNQPPGVSLFRGILRTLLVSPVPYGAPCRYSCGCPTSSIRCENTTYL